MILPTYIDIDIHSNMGCTPYRVGYIDAESPAPHDVSENVWTITAVQRRQQLQLLSPITTFLPASILGRNSAHLVRSCESTHTPIGYS